MAGSVRISYSGRAIRHLLSLRSRTRGNHSAKLGGRDFLLTTSEPGANTLPKHDGFGPHAPALGGSKRDVGLRGSVVWLLIFAET